MRRRTFIAALAGAAYGPIAAPAETERVPRLGVVGIGSAPSSKPVIDAFRQGLRDFGYVEGKTILVEDRFTGGNSDLAPKIVADLINSTSTRS
jgi:putative ABC transport system substrate-binding protein